MCNMWITLLMQAQSKSIHFEGNSDENKWNRLIRDQFGLIVCPEKLVEIKKTSLLSLYSLIFYANVSRKHLQFNTHYHTAEGEVEN